jgi:hypothetical protein
MEVMLVGAQTAGDYAHHFNTSINSYLFTQSALEDKSQIQRLKDEKWQATSSTIMRNLRFASIHARLDAITTAHKKTFEWIFEECFGDPYDEKTGEGIGTPYNDYTRWLQNGTGMYWIQGKAASGKSTLMHFIATHEKTMRNLRIWSGSSSLIVLRFYFWNSGDHEQRSLTGLLRSLLFEILAGHGSAIHYVFPSEWSEFYEYNIEPQPWRLPNLHKALTAAIRYLSSNFKMCFFVDGLDEYEGDHVELTRLFKKLADNHDQIKFCVSSRPWTQFDEFASNAPRLMLQDLTKDDILAYVVDNLGKNEKMLQLSDEDPDSVHELINEIVERASGVFLWVEIVVKSLMNGLRNSDDISRLQRRLQALPKDLENLYEHMLKGIENFYKEDASIVFEIFRMARIYPIPERSFNIPALYRVLKADFRTATSKKIEPRSEEKCDQIKRFKTYQGLEIWLRNCCKGLLEVDVVLEDDLEVFRNELRFPPIRYMHRTVKDYLEEIPVRQYLSSFIKDPTVDSNLSFLISDIIELKEMSPSQRAREPQIDRNLMDRALKLARSMNSLMGAQKAALLDELDRALSHCWSKNYLDRRQGVQGAGNHWSDSYTPGVSSQKLERDVEFPTNWGHNFLSLAIYLDLDWYVDRKLTQDPSILQPNETLPLLAHALKWKLWHLKDGEIYEPDSLKSLEILLRHGADPNQLYGKYSLWQYFIHFIHVAYQQDAWPGWWCWDATKLMLEYGAGPDSRCITEGRDWIAATCPPSRPTLLDPHLCGCNTLAEIITEIFHPEDATTLIQTLQGKKKLASLPTQKQRRSRKRTRAEASTPPASDSSPLELSIRGISFPLINSLGLRGREDGFDTPMSSQRFDLRPWTAINKAGNQEELA